MLASTNLETERRRAVRWLVGASIALAAMLLLFESTSWDLALQDHFYSFEQHSWWVERAAPAPRLWFYDGPKRVLYGVGVGMLLLWIAPASLSRRAGVARRDLAVAVLTLAAVPLLAGQFKGITNVHCPRHIRRYGGDVPYVRLFEHYPEEDRPARRGRCFPAGHASGGFGLLGLLWLRRSRRWRAGAIALAMVAGWTMGAYQMLNGSHYLSHTLTTMLLAVIVTTLLRLLIPPREPSQASG